MKFKIIVASLAAASTLSAGLLVPSAFAAISDTSPAKSETVTTAKNEAEEPKLLADFSFDDAVNGFEGANAVALSQGKINLVDSHTGSGKAAQFGNSAWLKVTSATGDPLLKDHDSLTISYDSKASDKSAQGWTVFAAPNDSQVNGNAPTYLGVMDQTSQVRVERYADGRDDANTLISQQENSDWKHVDLVISGKQAKLYVNKVLVATKNAGKTLAEVTSGSGGVLQIGKANWGGGEYFTGLLDNFKIFDRALTASQLGIPAPTSIVIGGDNVQESQTSIRVGGVAALLAKTVPETGVDSSVVWSSSDDAIVSVDSTGHISGIKAGKATVTAASQSDNSIQASVEVSVTSVKEEDSFGYVMVHFVEDSNGYKEKIYLDISQGDNPERWDPLNGGEPVLASNESTTGVRDPFIAYNPTTKTYYLLATDLRVFGSDNAGWGTWTNQYSTKLHVWETKDFIHFSDMKTFDTGADTSNKTLTKFTDAVSGDTIADLGMAWAPEATWVNDFYDLNDDGINNNSAQGGAFVIYWTANPSINGENRHNRVMWGYTSDFTQGNFHLGGVFVDSGSNTIDTTMLQRQTSLNSAKEPFYRSYRMSKDNGKGQGIFMQYTDQQDWWKAQDWKTTQTKIGAEWAGGNAGGVEGPAGFKDHNSDKWYLYTDVIPSTGYRPMVSTDLDADTPWSVLDNSNFYMTPSTKHGGIVSITKAQYDAIRAADAKKSDNDAIEPKKISVEQNSSIESVSSLLPKAQTVKTATGEAVQRKVTWDLSQLDMAQPGTVSVSGIVDTLGANLNHWVGDDDVASGWSSTGGFQAQASDRPLYSSTAITVPVVISIEERVPGETDTENPEQPDSSEGDGNHVGDSNNAADGQGSHHEVSSLAATGSSIAAAVLLSLIGMTAGFLLLRHHSFSE